MQLFNQLCSYSDLFSFVTKFWYFIPLNFASFIGELEFSLESYKRALAISPSIGQEIELEIQVKKRLFYHISPIE